jgi:hypothetical protein
MWGHVEPSWNDGHRQIVGQRACGGELRAADTRVTAWQQRRPRDQLGRGTSPPPPPPPPPSLTLTPLWQWRRRLQKAREMPQRAGWRVHGGKAKAG